MRLCVTIYYIPASKSHNEYSDLLNSDTQRLDIVMAKKITTRLNQYDY
jgi:hypothetical protein